MYELQQNGRRCKSFLAWSAAQTCSQLDSDVFTNGKRRSGPFYVPIAIAVPHRNCISSSSATRQLVIFSDFSVGFYCGQTHARNGISCVFLGRVSQSSRKTVAYQWVIFYGPGLSPFTLLIKQLGLCALDLCLTINQKKIQFTV